MGLPTAMVQALQRVSSDGKCSLKALVRCKGMQPMVGLLNNPPPNPEDYAIYINEPGFYHLALGPKKPERKAFKGWVAHEVQQGAQIKSPRPHIINTVRNCSNCPLQ